MSAQKRAAHQMMHRDCKPKGRTANTLTCTEEGYTRAGHKGQGPPNAGMTVADACNTWLQLVTTVGYNSWLQAQSKALHLNSAKGTAVWLQAKGRHKLLLDLAQTKATHGVQDSCHRMLQLDGTPKGSTAKDCNLHSHRLCP